MMRRRMHANADADPSRAALDPIVEEPIGYGEIMARMDTLASRLRQAYSPHRPVALRLDHGADEALTELALLQARIPVLSLPAFFAVDQSQHAITGCGVQALISGHPLEGAQACRTAPVPLPAGTARITFTSGSTGSPKGICLSAEHMLRVARAVVEALGSGHAGRHLALLPQGILLETVAGLFATMVAGGTYVCPPQALAGMSDPFRPDYATMAGVIGDWRITSLILVPEYLAGLVRVMEETGLRLPLLTLVAVGGARTPPPLIARARALGLPVRQGYGLTECGSVVSLESAAETVSGSVGHPLGHVRASIASDGEILIDGSLCLGTVGSPREPGPLATGDLGRIDEAGRLWIEGRKSNLIVTSFGRNVSPEWIEEALLAQPAILQAMVYGDGLAAPEALLVPAYADADLAGAVRLANATRPAYARIARWREAAHFTPLNGQLTGNGRLLRSAIADAYLASDPAFFTKLETATIRDRLRFLSIAQVRAGLSGEISRATYIAYLSQAWQHVRHTVPLLRAARQGLAHGSKLAAALDEYIAEETGHDEWILSDIAAAGGDVDAARRSDPSAATQAMIDHAYSGVRSRPISLFGMIYVLESVSVAIAQRGAAAVRQRLGLPEDAFTYLTSHGALDENHMRFFARQVNALCDPGDRAAIVAMARRMFQLFGGVFASIPLEHEDATA